MGVALHDRRGMVALTSPQGSKSNSMIFTGNEVETKATSAFGLEEQDVDRVNMRQRLAADDNTNLDFDLTTN
jgi:hypothetical protein